MKYTSAPWLLLLFLFGSACASKKEAPVTTTAAPSPLRRVTLAPETVTRLALRSMKVGDTSEHVRIRVNGSIEYDVSCYAEVGPRLDGRVTALRARLGDRVKKGELLAELSVPSLAETQAEQITRQAELEAARKNAERERRLSSQNMTTAREVEVADSELKQAEARTTAALVRLRALGGGNGSNIGGSMALIAPIDGTVVQRNVVLGGFVGVSTTAYVVADTSKLLAYLDVHESDMQFVNLNATVRFTADSQPGREFSGKVSWISPEVSRASRLVRTRVDVPNEDGLLRPGMFIRASIDVPIPEKPDSELLPARAVQPLGNEDVVFVETGPGAYEVRPVTIVRQTSELVELRSTLKHGDRVVIDGAFLLRAEVAKQ